jgi:decaprenylphospho-beta-D-erythro-pentofuranosid-2-ulose 2-reductase
MTTGEKSTSKTPRALIVGATSSLAQPLCRMLSARGYTLVLAARDKIELETLAADLRARYGAQCSALIADFLSAEFTSQKLLEDAGEITHLILIIGDMGTGMIADLRDIAFTTHVNYTVPAQIAAGAAASMVQRGGGHIVIISSVAGDRGRGRIGAYSAAKAALTTFAAALRNAYAKKGVHVLTVKPGFTDTPMTWGIKSPLMASREEVARKILIAMHKKKNVVYIPWFWRYIMLVITHIPECIFKRMSL